VAAVAPRPRGRKPTPMDKFRFDFKRALMTDKEKTVEDIHRFFGGLAKKG
jgi:hypothetical protein